MRLKRISIMILFIFLLLPIASEGAEKSNGNKYEISSNDGQFILLDTETGHTWLLVTSFDVETNSRNVKGWVPIAIDTRKYNADETKTLWIYSPEDAKKMMSRDKGKALIQGFFQ